MASKKLFFLGFHIVSPPRDLVARKCVCCLDKRECVETHHFVAAAVATATKVARAVVVWSSSSLLMVVVATDKEDKIYDQRWVWVWTRCVTTMNKDS